MKDFIINNPYRVLGVYSNSPLKERVAKQGRLNAFAKVGKEVSFPEDFSSIISAKPIRTTESIAAAIAAINLDRDKLKYALFWFVKISVTDDIALKYLQTGNIDKAKEIFGKKESFTALVNRGVLALLEDDLGTGFSCISMVIHDEGYRKDFFQAIGITNLDIQESEVAELFITEMLKEFPAQKLLDAAINKEDKALIAKKALEEPISIINAAIAVAKAADPKNAQENLSAGTKLMNSTKVPLKEVKDIAGASSSQYQMVADNVAKQVLQCGISYYNHASDSDVDSPRKAMILQSYALSLAVGQLTKDRCKENCDILQRVIDNMPPVEVAIEVHKVKAELKKFCQLPDEISHAVTLLNNTKPILQTIKSKLGATNTFYLSLSTQVVSNALHNVIEEVNRVQDYFKNIIKAMKESGIDPSIFNYVGDEHSPAKIINNKVKPVMREAWKITVLMDSFDMESDFKIKRYDPNRKTLVGLCRQYNISTSTAEAVMNGLDSANRATGGCLGSLLGYIIFGLVILLIVAIISGISSLF